jgi:hypothetical protein
MIKFLMWPVREIAMLLFDSSIPLGRLAPWVFAVVLWSWPRKIDPK